MMTRPRLKKGVAIVLMACGIIACRGDTEPAAPMSKSETHGHAPAEPQSTVAMWLPARPRGAANKKPQPRKEFYALPGIAHGLVQSPVNILSGKTVEGHHDVALHYDHIEASFVLNTGYTVELDFPKGSSITFDGKDYDLKQVHFHTPSEHQIDGLTYPMSAHIVNMRPSARPKSPPEYLVIGVLFRMGAKNDFVESFLDAVPSTPGTRKKFVVKHVYVDELFPEGEIPEYYHYRGSLTTPPYTETVEWLVLKKELQASPQQIRRINAIEGDNARHVQALYDRTVED